MQETHQVGFGVMLVNTEVYRKVPLPWFSFEWLPEKQIYRGEDYFFCMKVRAAGYPIFIDHDVSKEVRHLGEFGYSPIFKAMALHDAKTGEKP